MGTTVLKKKNQTQDTGQIWLIGCHLAMWNGELLSFPDKCILFWMLRLVKKVKNSPRLSGACQVLGTISVPIR